jgi:hypothetical protein
MKYQNIMESFDSVSVEINDAYIVDKVDKKINNLI